MIGLGVMVAQVLHYRGSRHAYRRADMALRWGSASVAQAQELAVLVCQARQQMREHAAVLARAGVPRSFYEGN